ncbi:MAG TPA: hypothetical protein VHC69_06785 [Polyangiaceae bacterium]|nr:hypothetical protein [Polyangiaceae bacterium]
MSSDHVAAAMAANPRFAAASAAWEALFLRACEQSGLDRAELLRRCKTADWRHHRLAAEIEVEGWLDRLNEAVSLEEERRRRQRENSIKGAVNEAFRSGPRSMVELDAGALLKLIPAPLQKIARELRSNQGGVLALGPTGIGKTATMVLVGRRLIREGYEEREAKQAERGERFFGIDVAGVFGWARAADLATARRRHALGSEAPEIEAAKKPFTLVIDDLGWEGNPENPYFVARQCGAEREG